MRALSVSAGSCSNWGGSNYLTFDGTPYSFRDACTHVLVKEIRPRLGNLTVLLDNHYCRAAAAPCPRALIIHYESMEVVLTTTAGASGQESLVGAGQRAAPRPAGGGDPATRGVSAARGGLQRSGPQAPATGPPLCPQVLFDHVRVSHGFSKDGVSVSMLGSTAVRVDIPAIGASVTLDGHVFQIQLSYSHFANNTEGQCGEWGRGPGPRRSGRGPRPSHACLLRPRPAPGLGHAPCRLPRAVIGGSEPITAVGRRGR